MRERGWSTPHEAGGGGRTLQLGGGRASARHQAYVLHVWHNVQGLGRVLGRHGNDFVHIRLVARGSRARCAGQVDSWIHGEGSEWGTSAQL